MHAFDLLVGMVIAGAAAMGSEVFEVRLDVKPAQIETGRSVAARVSVFGAAHEALEGARVLTYVNGKRWGAHEVTEHNGSATVLLPLPNAGVATIQAQAFPSTARPSWIYAPAATDNQTVQLRHVFRIDQAPQSAYIRVAVDDSCKIYLNDGLVGEAAGWSGDQRFPLGAFLHEGENVLRVVVANSSGPAGFVAVLTMQTPDGEQTIATDESWQWAPDQVNEWQPCAVLGPLDEVMWWADGVSEWPMALPRKLLFAGHARPENGHFSNEVSIEVTSRQLRVKEDPEHLIGIQWEPWFTPMNAYWQTAQAVPLVGYYDSFNPDVIRQHAIWLIDAGINWLLVDWSNHIWGKQHWDERPPSAQEIIDATTFTLEQYALLRKEGMPVPKFVLMPGLSNGPPTTMGAINEALEWIDQHYLQNPEFDGLWVMHEGKPLIVPLDCAYLAVKPETPPVDDSRFTVRWMGTQLQITGREKDGYWSWMDGSLAPIVTYRDGKPEVVTPTPAYFADGGWLYPNARGRRGGTTMLESFRVALETRPQFIMIHQWNEFAGQPEGQGYGDKHDIYVDSYSVELSDDLEPVSLTADGYRGDKGGWGFYYLNLMQALIDLFHQAEIQNTVLAVYPPDRGATVEADSIEVAWTFLGKAPESFSVLLDGKAVAESIAGDRHRIDLSEVDNGEHVVTVVANGATTHFELAYEHADVRSLEPLPVSVAVPFVLKKKP